MNLVEGKETTGASSQVIEKNAKGNRKRDNAENCKSHDDVHRGRHAETISFSRFYRKHAPQHVDIVDNGNRTIQQTEHHQPGQARALLPGGEEDKELAEKAGLRWN